jgi:hypothetical protein
LGHIRADLGHALTHVDALLALNGRHDQLRKPGILAGAISLPSSVRT